MNKKISLFILTIFLVICLPVFVGASDYLPKNKGEGGNVVVTGDKEYKNLFVGGGNIAINKKIFGDLFAVGGSIDVASPVEKDFFAAGGNLIIFNAVGDDARLAGGNITVSSPIGGDLMVAGGTVNISQNATVEGDFWVGAGVLNLNGHIKGNVKIAAGEALINSEINGDVEVKAEKKLVFGPQSRVLGKIVYWGTNKAVMQDGAQISQIEFHKKEESRNSGKINFIRIFSMLLLIKILALLVASFVMLRLFGKTSHSVVSRLHVKPWTSLLIGFLGIITVPIATLILLMSVLGLLTGLILIFWFILTLLFSSVFVVFFIGSLLERWLFKKSEVNLTWKTAVWGLLLLGVSSFIPILGWIAMSIAYFLVFGSLLQELRTRLEI